MRQRRGALRQRPNDAALSRPTAAVNNQRMTQLLTYVKNMPPRYQVLSLLLLGGVAVIFFYSIKSCLTKSSGFQLVDSNNKKSSNQENNGLPLDVSTTSSFSQNKHSRAQSSNLPPEKIKKLIQDSLWAFVKRGYTAQDEVEPYIRTFLEKGILEDFIEFMIKEKQQYKLKAMGVLSKEILQKFLQVAVKFFPPEKYPDFIEIGSAADGDFGKYELIFSYYPEAANGQSSTFTRNTHILYHYL